MGKRINLEPFDETFGNPYYRAPPLRSDFDGAALSPELKETHETIQQAVGNARQESHRVLKGAGQALEGTKEVLDTAATLPSRLQNGLQDADAAVRDTAQSLKTGVETLGSVGRGLSAAGEWLTGAPKALTAFNDAVKGVSSEDARAETAHKPASSVNHGAVAMKQDALTP